MVTSEQKQQQTRYKVKGSNKIYVYIPHIVGNNRYNEMHLLDSCALKISLQVSATA